MSAVNKLRSKALWQRAISISRGAEVSHDDQSLIGSGGTGTGSMFRSSNNFHKLASNLWESKKVLEKEKELKSKEDELSDLKSKYGQEQSERQKLQKQLDDLCSSQTDSSRKLLRAQDVAEKLRTDNRKKAEQIEKLDKTISHMEDRIRNLEIRASEVEKAELTLDSTRRALENSQIECRSKEKELERERQKYDEVCKNLEKCRHQMGELEGKLEDLKIQVRHELMKNENIEKGLETIPRLKEDIEERDVKITSLQKEVEEKSVLLNASRRTARDYKEQLREIERRDVETICLREELEVARNEVDTLKRLMGGKDMMVLQKCQALDTAKSAVSSLRASASSDSERSGLRQIQTVLDQLRQIYTDSVNNSPVLRTQKPVPHNRFAQSRPRSALTYNQDHNRGIDVNHHPYSADSNGNNNPSSNSHTNNHSNGEFGPDMARIQDPPRSSTYVFLERFLEETEGLDGASQKRARTAPAPTSNGTSSSIQRRASFHNIDQHPQGVNHSNISNHGAGLHSRRKATSSQNVNTSRPFSSALSPRGKKTSASSSNLGPNLYVSESTSNKLKHQPSLEYCLGLSTDDELTTENTYCLSGRKKSAGSSTNTSSGRSRTAFTVSKRGHSATGSDSESGSHEYPGEGGKLSHQQLMALSRLSGSEKDRMLADVIHVGDRVAITETQKPPRYGRKKPKPVTHTGIVKYKGMLDNDHYDARVYVGLRLDSPLGDSDGTFKGKRYMFTPQDHGKFFKIRDLDCVLDVTSSQYIPTSRLLLRLLEPNYSLPLHSQSAYNSNNNTSNNNNTNTTSSASYSTETGANHSTNQGLLVS